MPVAPLAHGDSVDAGKGQGTPSTADLAALDQKFAHFLPGADDPTLDERRTRKQNAVLLVAPPSKSDPEPGIARAETIRFQPVLCSIAGKLGTGSRCGEIMPARTTLRITDPGLSFATEELVVSRSSAQPADADGKKLAPPMLQSAACTTAASAARLYPTPTDRGYDGACASRRTLCVSRGTRGALSRAPKNSRCTRPPSCGTGGAPRGAETASLGMRTTWRRAGTASLQTGGASRDTGTASRGTSTASRDTLTASLRTGGASRGTGKVSRPSRRTSLGSMRASLPSRRGAVRTRERASRFASGIAPNGESIAPRS